MIINTYNYTYFSEKNKIKEAVKILDDKLIFNTYILLKINYDKNVYTFTVENKDDELNPINLDNNYIFVFSSNYQLKNFINTLIITINYSKEFNNNIRYNTLTSLIILLLSENYNSEVFFIYKKYEPYTIENYKYFNEKYNDLIQEKINNNNKTNFILRFKQMLEEKIFNYLFE